MKRIAVVKGAPSAVIQNLFRELAERWQSDIRIAGVVEQLVVYKDRMQANLDSLGGLVFSQRILLALTQKGMSREASYAAVQRNAMDAWRGNASLLALCRADKEIGEFLADDELTALFDMSYHTKHVDTIFKRVFG